MKHIHGTLVPFIKSIFSTPKRRSIIITGVIAIVITISLLTVLVNLSNKNHDELSNPVDSYDETTVGVIVDDITTINSTESPDTSGVSIDSTDESSGETIDTVCITEITIESAEVTETEAVEGPTPTDPSTDSIQTDPSPVDTVPDEYYDPIAIETTTQTQQIIPEPTETTTNVPETQPKPVETTTNMKPVEVPVEDETYDNVYEIIIG